jgi:flagellar biosynthesis protein FlhF
MVHMKKLLEANLRAPQKVSMGYGQVICMVGTNGSGKTSACAKLAAYYKHVEGKNVVWIGADTVRTAAISEARIYADSLGIAFKPVYTPEELNKAVTEDGVDVFMVDLPGVNPRNEKSLVDLGSLISPLKRRITYLVVSATTKDADLQQCYAALGAYNLDGILVSKMDETESLGNIYNFALLTQMPLVWFSKGHNILDDLEPASPTRLVNELLVEGRN